MDKALLLTKVFNLNASSKDISFRKDSITINDVDKEFISSVTYKDFDIIISPKSDVDDRNKLCNAYDIPVSSVDGGMYMLYYGGVLKDYSYIYSYEGKTYIISKHGWEQLE